MSPGRWFSFKSLPNWRPTVALHFHLVRELLREIQLDANHGRTLIRKAQAATRNILEPGPYSQLHPRINAICIADVPRKSDHRTDMGCPKWKALHNNPLDLHQNGFLSSESRSRLSDLRDRIGIHESAARTGRKKPIHTNSSGKFDPGASAESSMISVAKV